MEETKHQQQQNYQEQPDSNTSKDDVVTGEGGCHCGSIRFRFTAPANVSVYRCNCSVCYMKQNPHFVVPESDFEILQGSADKISLYTFGTHTAKHKFCSVCGIHAFYNPRSNQNGVAVNVHCVDDDLSKTFRTVAWKEFDGQNWEKQYETSDIKQWSK